MKACFGGLHPGHIFISTLAPGTFHVRAFLVHGFFRYVFFIYENLSSVNSYRLLAIDNGSTKYSRGPHLSR
jgi:type IV secretory pathway TrbL component